MTKEESFVKEFTELIERHGLSSKIEAVIDDDKVEITMYDQVEIGTVDDWASIKVQPSGEAGGLNQRVAALKDELDLIGTPYLVVISPK